MSVKKNNTDEKGEHLLSSADAIERIREFLVSAPLLQRLSFSLADGVSYAIFPETLSMPCPRCIAVPSTTWRRMATETHPPGVLLTYRCDHCEKDSVTYWIRWNLRGSAESGSGFVYMSSFQHLEYRKVGQWPAWSIGVPKEISNVLSTEEIALYRKGLMCMSQSFGLGAVTYFRRLIEDAVYAILDLIEEAALSEGDNAALAEVKSARSKKNANVKLRVAAGKVPLSLRPGGINPLQRLYDLYSVGIHGLTDEECLEIALRMRFAFDFTFKNLRTHLNESKKFRAALQA